MGIRPLKNKVVLLNDDNLTIQKLQEGISLLSKKYKETKLEHVNKIKNCLERFQNTFKSFMHKKEFQNDKIIIQELIDNGFKVVKVPSNIVRPLCAEDATSDTHYLSNYMNAIVHENKDGDLVYITNKSPVDRVINTFLDESDIDLGFSMQKVFKDSIKDYVKPENVYFVSGKNTVPEMLENYQGGIHCMCSEVPD